MSSISVPINSDIQYLPCPHVQLKLLQMRVSFLHHNQFFGVIIKASDYDVKNLIVRRKAHWPLEPPKLDVYTGQVFLTAWHRCNVSLAWCCL